ncbi:Dehydrogenase (flavoprotein) [Anaerobranca californiensis DSM 14826]|uniref:Dehydrogenase (Flavoprotein) n=2 Tax=Anaerobranca TaxID=42447 RepID=A0A1M6P177_9FIRM|nr:NAD(P)-binding protein [Anaerobranca californiensis]SHK01747.1 Dehydrogenase (flavoprotein) [Anaerobranca californiensis DSM 14826]
MLNTSKKKVAILGAGVSGLSCAIELEKYGIYPDIYETNKLLGSRGFNHALGWINLMYRPVRDPMIYLEEKYNIPLRAIEEIRRVNFYTANNFATMTGKLGYIHMAGPDERGILAQLKAFIKSPIHFNAIVNFRDLAKEYEHVVIATGTPEIPKLLGVWKTDVVGYVRGATVKGYFDPYTVVMWLNTKYAQRAYAYFVPWNDRKGSLILNCQEITGHAAGKMYDMFIDDIKWDVEFEEFHETPHTIGHVQRHQIDNLYLIGLAGGFLDPLFAFGNIESIESGLAAARSIALGWDFTKQIHLWLRRNQQLLMLRRYVDKFKDEDFDKVFDVVKSPGFRTIVSKTNINIIYIISKLANTLAGDKVDRVLW